MKQPPAGAAATATPAQGAGRGADIGDYIVHLADALPRDFCAALLREYRDEVEAGGTGFNVSEDAYAIADAMLKARSA